MALAGGALYGDDVRRPTWPSLAARMFERADLLGHSELEHYLWRGCQWGRYDAINPMLKWDTASRALRDAAGLPGGSVTVLFA